MAVRKVVITGTGAISPFGMGMDTLMKGLYAGNSAVVSQKAEWEQKIPELNCWVGAPVQDPLPAKTIPRKQRRTMGRAAIMALLAAREAIEEAGLDETTLHSGRTGVFFSSTTGSTEAMIRFFDAYFHKSAVKDVSSGTFFQIMSHTCAANIAHALQIRGRVLSPDSACSSSTQAIGLAYETIKHGDQEIILCGGSDELTAIVCGSFDLLNATSYRFNDRPAETPRPFDRDRDGTVCGEGAGCIVLESEESALARGADIILEIAGFSTSSDGTHLAQPNSKSIIACIKNALDNAGVRADGIDYINAHATGTLQGDRAEARAIHDVFGENTPVSGFKGHMGHTLGASGVLELAACARMVQENMLIPTLNLAHPGEGCEGVDLVTGLQKRRIELFVKNSFAFGGINAVLIARRYK